jgi:squalene-hopene/tetraprenyl-beta-curcumene cyclase
MSTLFALAGSGSDQRAMRVQADYEREVTALALPGLTLPTRPPDVVHVAPWLFADIAPAIADDGRCTVAVSALLYRDYLLAFDAPIDGETPVDALQLLAAGLWHERALTRLARVVPRHSRLWKTLGRLARRQVAAAADERTLIAAVQAGIPYTFDVFAALSAAKAAVFTAVPSACCAASGNEPLVDVWDAVIDPFSIAAQIRDDLTDWRTDWIRGRTTYAHLRALEVGGLLPSVAAGGRPDAETVGHFLFHGGVASELLADAMDACAASTEAAHSIGAHQWARFAQHVAGLCEGMSAKIAERRTRASETAARPVDTASVHHAVTRLVESLTHERAGGYSEASHRMRYHRTASDTFVRPGGDPPDDIHEGSVFSRAIIGWFYDRCERAGIRVPAESIDENLEALLDLRVPGEGQWSYHPTLAALPPDLDCLAQVLHAFLARPVRNLEDIFLRPIGMALDEQTIDGAIETWIIGSALNDGWKAWYARQISEFWGAGAEPEVVANFASAILSWKPEAYATAVHNAANYVAAQQAPDGSWRSTWYVGPYYGTFVATRLLRAVTTSLPAATPALRRTRSFLLGSQRSDGGWGTEEYSDVLSTALALLALSDVTADTGDGAIHRAIAKGVQWLLLVQRSDALWAATTDFVRFDMNRQMPAYGERLGFYRSVTITSTFAGAALLAAKPWLNGI